MGRVRMCLACRQRKVKCEPLEKHKPERIWVEGGSQQKCARCDKYGHECGPSQYASEQPPARRSSDNQRSRRIGNTAAVSEQQPLLGERAHLPVRTAEDLAEDRIELKRRLEKVDEHVDASTILQNKISLAKYPDLANLHLLKIAILDEILSLLQLAVQMADGLELFGETDAAENAYIRMIAVYRTINPNAWYEVKKLLQKLATMTWKLGQDQRAQNFAWEALQCRESPLVADQSDLDWLKKLASSLSQTSNNLSNIVRSTVGIAHLGQLLIPRPVLHNMMNSEYASSITGNIFWTAALPDPNHHPPHDHPIVGELSIALAFVQQLEESDLEARDYEGRSPLFMAAGLGKEAFGLAIMMRASKIPAMKARIMDAKDITSQTILGIAIWGECSLTFIKALIDHGVELNPEMSTIMNPLQVASWMGSLEVVDLLLKRGASQNRTPANGKTALDFARERGHHHIVRCLSNGSEDSPESFSAPPNPL